MIPNNAIRNVKRGYAAIIKKVNKPNQKQPILVTTICMNEDLIWGINQKPKFLFSGKFIL